VRRKIYMNERNIYEKNVYIEAAVLPLRVVTPRNTRRWILFSGGGGCLAAILGALPLG